MSMSNKLIASVIFASALAAAVAAPLGGAQAATFTDTFDEYPLQVPNSDGLPTGSGTKTWTQTGVSIDVIGAGGPFDFYPGNGHYIDLNGTPGPGALQTFTSFAAGNYTLSFDLGGNHNNDGEKTTIISLGNWSVSLTLASHDPLALYSYGFSTTGGPLSFAMQVPLQGNENIGNILDNVTLTATPLPSTWLMLIAGFAGFGFLAYRGAKKGATALSAA